MVPVSLLDSEFSPGSSDCRRYSFRWDFFPSLFFFFGERMKERQRACNILRYSVSNHKKV